MTAYDALEPVCGKASVEVSWYKLCASDAPIAPFQIHSLLVEPVEGAHPSTIWPKKKRAAPRYPRRPCDGQGGVAAEVLALEDGEAHESEEESEASENEDDGRPRDEMLGLLDEVEDFDFGAALEEPDREANEDAEVQVVAPLAEDAPPAAAVALGTPVVVPPPPLVPAPGGGLGRRSATVVFQVPGGSIAYYESKRSFEAVCDNPSHGRCVVTRTKNHRGQTPDGHPKGGRPVGFLAAWLARGSNVESKAQHWDAPQFEIPAEERAAVRATIAASGESGRFLLGLERAQAPGEPEEPSTVDGYRP